jgi:subtilisin family serine protease
MIDPLSQTRLDLLMSISSGSPDISIGLIDGPIDFSHPAFHGSKIRTVKDSQFSECKNADSIACAHGTFTAGILCAKRGQSAPAICPSCEIILNPIFRQDPTNGNNSNKISKDVIINLPSATPEELSNAIIETIDAGAKIINLSLGLSAPSLTSYVNLQEAYDYALQRRVIIVVAAGNQGNIGNISLINHEWLIPVAACDANGKLDPMSNFGPSIGKRGLMAPGVNIRSTYPVGQYTHMGGTSFSAPFVTGAIALLWSIFTKATAERIIYSVISAASNQRRRPSIIPPLLNAEEAFKLMRSTIA